MNQVISQAVGQSTKAFFLLGRIQDWKEVSKMLSSLRSFDQDKVAQERLRIINFYQGYGEKATQEAFRVDRKLIFIWRKKLQENQNQFSALTPQSTRPRESGK